MTASYANRLTLARLVLVPHLFANRVDVTHEDVNQTHQELKHGGVPKGCQQQTTILTQSQAVKGWREEIKQSTWLTRHEQHACAKKIDERVIFGERSAVVFSSAFLCTVYELLPIRELQLPTPS